VKTNDYLDALKAKLDLRSDYQLAQTLDTSTAAIGQYRTGKRTMDDYTAARVAELLGMEPLILIAQANAEREKDSQKAAFWRKYAAGVIGAALVSFGLSITPETAGASTTCTGRVASNINYGCLRRRLARLIRAAGQAVWRAVARLDPTPG
jgi:hypothetical protein